MARVRLEKQEDGQYEAVYETDEGISTLCAFSSASPEHAALKLGVVLVTHLEIGSIEVADKIAVEPYREKESERSEQWLEPR